MLCKQGWGCVLGPSGPGEPEAGAGPHRGFSLLALEARERGGSPSVGSGGPGVCLQGLPAAGGAPAPCPFRSWCRPGGRPVNVAQVEAEWLRSPAAAVCGGPSARSLFREKEGSGNSLPEVEFSG